MTKNIISTIDINDQLKSAAKNYSAEVIAGRAIPDLRDGLKPVNRRVIYSMEDNHLEPNKPHRKSAFTVGNVIADLHAHGDSSVYQAMVIMTQDFSNNVVLIDGHGNFGSIEGHANAAMRYTEARMSKYAKLLTDGLNKDAVNMVPNFDGTRTEPEVLPVSFPLALTNGTDGIAWGMSTQIAPHNVQELLKAAIYLEKTINPDVKDLVKIIKGPDFPTGCDVIVDPAELEKEIRTGKAKYIMRARIDVKPDKKEPKLIIKSLPYQVKLDSKFFNRLVDVTQEAKAFNVESITNSTKDSNIHLEIICKAGTSEEKLNQLRSYLYKETSLEKSITVNNLMLDKGVPKVLGIARYLHKFNAFRLQTLKNIWQYDKEKLLSRLEIIEGLFKSRDIIDDIIAQAKIAESKTDLIEKLIKLFEFTEKQANYVASLQIYQLGKQNFEVLAEEEKLAREKVNELNLWLTDSFKSSEKLIEDLENTLSKLKDIKRNSKILDPSAISSDSLPIKLDELIEATKTKVIIKQDLQMFQIGRVAYNNQIEKYVDNDIVAALDAMTTDYVIAITKDGQAVTRFVNDLQQINLDGRAKRLNEEVDGLKASNSFVGGIIVDKNNKTDKFFILTTEGKVKVGYFDKLMPKITNKGYIKRLSKAMGLKTETDTVALVKQFSPKDFDSLEMHVTLKDNSKKSGKVIRKVEISKFKDREDTKNGAGTSGVNTKKGELPYISTEFIKKK